MAWTASCWDEASVDFIDQFDPPFYKIASASLTDDALLRHTRAKGKPIVLSTGMSTLDQIDHAVEVLGKDDLVLLHCCSTYPSQYGELNLRVDPDAPRALRRAGRVLGPRDRDRVVRRGGDARSLHRRAPHHPGPLDVGIGSGGLARAERDHAGRPRHPPRGDRDGRRRQAVLPSEIPVMQKLRRVGL